MQTEKQTLRAPLIAARQQSLHAAPDLSGEFVLSFRADRHSPALDVYGVRQIWEVDGRSLPRHLPARLACTYMAARPACAANWSLPRRRPADAPPRSIPQPCRGVCEIGHLAMVAKNCGAGALARDSLAKQGVMPRLYRAEASRMQCCPSNSFVRMSSFSICVLSALYGLV